MALALHLRLQVSTPSNHLWSAFLLPAPPQFLYQAPPGAQQLTLPDFSNVPHLRHAIVFSGVLIDVVLDVRAISSRSNIGGRVTYSRVSCTVGGGRVNNGVSADVHTVRGIDPYELRNMNFLLAFEWIQAAPQSFRLKVFAL